MLLFRPTHYSVDGRTDMRFIAWQPTRMLDTCFHVSSSPLPLTFISIVEARDSGVLQFVETRPKDTVPFIH